MGTMAQAELATIDREVERHLQAIDETVDSRILAAVFNLPASMPRGGPVATEKTAGGGKREAEPGMRKVHGNLAGKGDVRRTATGRSDFLDAKPKRGGDDRSKGLRHEIVLEVPCSGPCGA
jgi:hypothetical protein